MNPQEKELSGLQQLDWGQFRPWRVWDPIPWWILDKGKIEQIMAVQLEGRVNQMKNEIEQLEKVIKIVGR